MKKKLLVVALIIAVLAVVVFIYRQPIILRITGMKPFVEDRFGGWVSMGAEEKELDAALKKIHDPKGSGPGSWVYELSVPAAEHETAAKQAESSGDRDKAAAEYKTASVFYYIARFPFVGSLAKEKAYRKHIECYLKAAESFDPPLEIVRIPFEGKEIIGYLRSPNVDKPPVIILTGGVDTWKSDMDEHIGSMLDQDLAVLAMDMPGTGESVWPLAPDGVKVYQKAIEYLQSRPDLDGDRLGIYMISFGGYFAVKLALEEPAVKASVNVGGPLELCFRPEHIKIVPDVMIATIAHAMGLEVKNGAEEMAEAVKHMPLSAQGLLGKPKHQAALLSINGAKDELVTIDDLYILSKNGIKQDEWVYENDGHCAPRNVPEYSVKAAKWLKEKLAE